jgi:hypothetical protein
MPRVQWPLQHGRPCVHVMLSLMPSDQPLPRVLLADTGAGARDADMEVILDEDDCLLCGGIPHPPIQLGGAYRGSFPVYELRIRLPALGFEQHLRAVGVPSVPTGFGGIACFGFVSRFSYGNFGDPGKFGLEV